MIRVGRVERYTWYLLRVFDRFDRFAVARLILGHVDIRSIRCKRAPVLADLTYGEERAREGREREREREEGAADASSESINGTRSVKQRDPLEIRFLRKNRGARQQRRSRSVNGWGESDFNRHRRIRPDPCVSRENNKFVIRNDRILNAINTMGGRMGWY